MAQDKYATMGAAIFADVGGPSNVAKLIHCMTRVRMTIIDEGKVKMAALKKIPGVLSRPAFSCAWHGRESSEKPVNRLAHKTRANAEKRNRNTN